MLRGKLNRDVTTKEYSSLSHDLKKGRVVYKFHGTTYGCISPRGVAVTDDKDGKEAFYEVPADSVTWE